MSRAARGRRLVCRDPGALDCAGRGTGARAARARRRARPPRFLLRLSSRILRDREPAAAPGRLRRWRGTLVPAFRLHRTAPMSTRTGGRRVGLLIPLFSCSTSTSWGIGDIGDLVPMATWLAAAGQRVLQLLPLNEMASGQQSPYSAISAMAIDPIYIRVQEVPEFAQTGGERLLSAEERAELDRIRQAARVDYAAVRRLKGRALAAAFDLFYANDWVAGSARAGELKAFLGDEAWWIDDYAVFRALHAREGNRAWMEWPAPLRARDPEALADVRGELAREILFYQYLQWIADTQWHAARAAARASGVELF